VVDNTWTQPPGTIAEAALEDQSLASAVAFGADSLLDKPPLFSQTLLFLFQPFSFRPFLCSYRCARVSCRIMSRSSSWKTHSNPLSYHLDYCDWRRKILLFSGFGLMVLETMAGPVKASHRLFRIIYNRLRRIQK
jgi:hypothetical protein